MFWGRFSTMWIATAISRETIEWIPAIGVTTSMECGIRTVSRAILWHNDEIVSGLNQTINLPLVICFSLGCADSVPA